MQAIGRYRDLEVLYAGRTRELARALQKLKALGVEPPQPRRRRPPGDEDAQIVSVAPRTEG